MPAHSTKVEFPPEMQDQVGVARVDGYVEVKSTLGYGVKVVTSADAALLIATGEWAALT